MAKHVHGGIMNELEAIEEEVQVLLSGNLPALGLLGKDSLKVPARAGFVLDRT